MTTTWILVANASNARLFANRGCNKGLELLEELEHPDSRKKGVDLMSDDRGRQQQSAAPNKGRPGATTARPALEPSTDPKEVEALQFAQELCERMDQGRTHKEYDRLVLIAPPHFLGLLRETLDHNTTSLVMDSLNKDYTKLAEKDLTETLGSILCP